MLAPWNEAFESSFCGRPEKSIGGRMAITFVEVGFAFPFGGERTTTIHHGKPPNQRETPQSGQVVWRVDASVPQWRQVQWAGMEYLVVGGSQMRPVKVQPSERVD